MVTSDSLRPSDGCASSASTPPHEDFEQEAATGIEWTIPWARPWADSRPSPRSDHGLERREAARAGSARRAVGAGTPVTDVQDARLTLRWCAPRGKRAATLRAPSNIPRVR